MSRASGPLTFPTDNKLAGPDHLRALAIILVFLFHYRLFNHPAWVDSIGSFGWTGVDLFFVLSGYLIAGQLFGQLHISDGFSLKEFYLKRFFRIIPAYLVVLGVYFCVPAFREREALPPLWKFLSFTQNFGLDLRAGGTFSHAWSLCIEEQFYLLLPFLLLVLSRFKLWRLGVLLPLCLFALGFAVRFFTWARVLEPLIDTDGFGLAWYKWMYYPTYNRLDGLLVGVSIAGVWTYYTKVRDFISRYCNWVLIFGLGILSYAYYLCLEPRSFEASIFGFPVIALGYGALLMAAISPRCFLYRVRSRVMSGIAGLSYAIYLSHKGIIHVTQGIGGKLGMAEDGSWMFVLCIVTCLTGALMLRYVVEQPFMKVRDRLLAGMSVQHKMLCADQIVRD